MALPPFANFAVFSLVASNQKATNKNTQKLGKKWSAIILNLGCDSWYRLYWIYSHEMCSYEWLFLLFLQIQLYKVNTYKAFLLHESLTKGFLNYFLIGKPRQNFRILSDQFYGGAPMSFYSNFLLFQEN